MSSIPNPEEVWVKSIVIEEDLQKMVEDLVLPEKSLIGWRATAGESFPTANTYEVVVFEPFFYWRFSLPTSSFFRGLLYWYGMELINLNPNSILHIFAFIHLCKVFPCVRPHFNLFCYLFTLKVTQKGDQINVVRGADLRLHQGGSAEYLGLPFKT